MASYVPPLRFHALTRFYDHVVRVTTRERAFKRALVNQVRARPAARLLDLGCGTGTLTLQFAFAYPDVCVAGLDADADALAIASRKVEAIGAPIMLQQSDARQLPFEDGCLDVVVASLFFHHLMPRDKTKTFAEIRRVLRPGELHVADWGRPGNLLLRGAFLLVQLLDGFENTRDNVSGALPRLIEEAGFREVPLGAPGEGGLVLARPAESMERTDVQADRADGQA